MHFQGENFISQYHSPRPIRSSRQQSDLWHLCVTQTSMQRREKSVLMCYGRNGHQRKKICVFNRDINPVSCFWKLIWLSIGSHGHGHDPFWSRVLLPADVTARWCHCLLISLPADFPGCRWTLHAACLAVLVLLDNPDPSSPLNCDAANLLRSQDSRGYSWVDSRCQLFG